MQERSVADDHTFDLRGTLFLGQQDLNAPDFNPKPVNVGGDNLPRHLCLVGGYVQGQHARDLGWEYLKHDPGSGDVPAFLLGGSDWFTVNGARVDNMMNGFRPESDGMLVQNAYLNYIRDDCLVNDELYSLRVVDSLFDGCYVAFSARPETGSPLYDLPRDTSVTELDRVLVRVQRMPGGHNISDPSVETFGHIWKWSPVSGPVVVRDSIFLVEPSGRGGASGLDWPGNITATNVTVVWTGDGSYPASLPSGVTVTKDIRVWDNARADWLARHGCTDIDHCNPTKLADPSTPGD